jgi:hypothetical protein
VEERKAARAALKPHRSLAAIAEQGATLSLGPDESKLLRIETRLSAYEELTGHEQSAYVAGRHAYEGVETLSIMSELLPGAPGGRYELRVCFPHDWRLYHHRDPSLAESLDWAGSPEGREGYFCGFSSSPEIVLGASYISFEPGETYYKVKGDTAPPKRVLTLGMGGTFGAEKPLLLRVGYAVGKHTPPDLDWAELPVFIRVYDMSQRPLLGLTLDTNAKDRFQLSPVLKLEAPHLGLAAGVPLRVQTAAEEKLQVGLRLELSVEVGPESGSPKIALVLPLDLFRAPSPDEAGSQLSLLGQISF